MHVFFQHIASIRSALCMPALRAAALAGSLALIAQAGAHAATISGTDAVFEYDAKINETNKVEIRGSTAGANIVLDVTDNVGLTGCTPLNFSATTVRCIANDLILFTMDMGDQSDVVTVVASPFQVIGYELSIDGGVGDDTLTGGLEDDEFFGGSGGDLLNGEGGADSLVGGLGNDRLLGGAGTDSLEGDSGSDIMFGEEGRDVLDGGVGDDTLNGGAGTDTLIGGSGNDFINAVDGERDTIDCGLGRDDRVRADPIDAVDNNCEDVDRINF